MANVYRYRRGPLVLRWVAKSGTVAIDQGDLIKHVSNVIKPASVSGDYSALVGVALAASPATDTSGCKVKIAEIGHGTVFEYAAAASDAHKYGERFKITGKQTLTKITAWSSCVAVCAESKDSSSTNTLVQFLPGTFQRPISRTGAGIV